MRKDKSMDKLLTKKLFFYIVIVVSELWGSQCVRLKVTVKSDNCGENAECSGKGVCYSNPIMVSKIVIFHSNTHTFYFR